MSRSERLNLKKRQIPEQAGIAISEAHRGKLRPILEAVTTPVIVIDSSHLIVLANASARDSLKRDHNDLIGERISSVIPSWDGRHLPPSGRAGGRDQGDVVSRVDTLGRCRRGDGSETVAHMTISNLEIDGDDYQLVSLIPCRLEAAFEETERKYWAVLEKSTENIFLMDPGTGRVLEANSTLCALLGYSNEELLRLTGYDFIAHAREDIEDKIAQVRQNGQLRLGERQYRRKDGSLVDVEVNVSVIDIGGKEILSVVSRDISRRKHDRAQLEIMSSIVQQTTEGIVLVDLDGHVKFVNESFAGMHRYAAAELIGQHLAVFHSEDQWAAVEATNKQTKATGHFSGEIWHVRKDGTRFPTLMNNSLLRDSSGEAVGMIGTALDISDLRFAESRFSHQNKFLENVIESLTHPFYVINIEDYSIALSNSAAEFGEGAACLKCYQRTHNRVEPCVESEHACPIEEIKRTNAPVNLEHTHVDAEGNKRYYAIHAYPLHDEDGELTQIIEYTVDITERKRAEHALRESEERYRRLVELSPEAMLVHSEGKIVYVNPAALKLFGADPEEGLGKSIFEYIHPDYHEIIAGRVKRLYENSEPTELIEAQLFRPDGNEMFVETMAVPITYAGKPAAQTIVRDITNRKKVEEAIRRSEREYRGLFESAHDAIIIFEPEREIVLDVNQRACDLYGFNRSEFIGLSLERISKDVQTGKQRLQATLEKGVYRSFESIQFRKDGTELHLDINASVVDYKGRQAILSINRDISARKRSEKALIESERIARALLNAPTDPSLMVDTEGRILAINDAACRTLDRAETELLGTPIYKYLPSGPAKSRQAHLQKVFETGQPDRFEDEMFGVVYDNIMYPVYNAEGTVDRVAIFARDVTEKSRAERSLRYKAEFENLIIRTSAQFINLNPEDVDDRVLLMLQSIGEFSEVDRSYVFLFDYDAMTMTNTHEWCADGISSEMENLQRVPLGEFSYFWKVMQNREVFHAPRISDLPSEAATEKAEFERERIKSLICVPMILGESVVGFLGFDSVRSEKSWSDDSIALLKVVGEILVGAQQRIKAEKALTVTMDQLEIERVALQEKNIALKQILEHIEQEKQNYKHQLSLDVENAVKPIMNRLRLKAGEDAMRELEQLEVSLDTVLSKDIDDFQVRMSKMTPRELEICHMITDGKTSKLIADELNLSLLTVHKHREQIRRKLGIMNKSVNLSTFLQSH